jgi:alpha-D-xyloside xylohydrolase
MEEAHQKGSPVMRALFYEFPQDARSWEVEEQYMYGDRCLVCPVLIKGQVSMGVYLSPLPRGQRWKSFWGEQMWDGGVDIEVDSPLEVMPVFERV